MFSAHILTIAQNSAETNINFMLSASKSEHALEICNSRPYGNPIVFFFDFPVREFCLKSFFIFYQFLICLWLLSVEKLDRN